MAVYKVPQDVEADDKLLGPFSFRQFIYLIVVAIACFMAYALSQIFIGLLVVPIPFILFFGALALPLRKDQPMEAYLLAIVQFHLKPKSRLWEPGGQFSLVEITAPRTPEPKRTKDISGDEASQRFSYLAQIMDTQGWASRGVSGPAGSALNNQFTEENQSTEDVLDEAAPVAQSFDSLISKQTSTQREKLTEDLKAAAKPAPKTKKQSSAPAKPKPAKAPKLKAADDEPKVHYSPYPSDMRQKVVEPLKKAGEDKPAAKKKPAEPKTTSETPSDEQPSPDIINLANTPFTISTIAHEAKRIKDKEAEEVVISLH